MGKKKGNTEQLQDLSVLGVGNLNLKFMTENLSKGADGLDQNIVSVKDKGLGK